MAEITEAMIVELTDRLVRERVSGTRTIGKESAGVFRLCDVEQLIAAARRSLEYEAFLREHRAALLDSLNYSSARTSGAYRAARDALLERLK